MADGVKIDTVRSTSSGVLTAHRRGSFFLLDFLTLTAVASQPPLGLLDSMHFSRTRAARRWFSYFRNEANGQWEPWRPLTQINLIL